jgi:hypothetical protein
MVVDHADRLHEGVADCRSDKPKTLPDKSLTHRLRLLGFRGEASKRFPGVVLCLPSDELPQELVE